jgi:hypothetical protein
MDQLTELYRNKVLDLQKKIALLENQLSLMEDDRVSRGKDVIAAQTQEAQRIGMGIPSKEAQEKEAKKREEFDKDIRKQSMLVAAEQEKITGKYDREDPSVKQQALLRVLMDKPELSDLVPEQEYVKLIGRDKGFNVISSSGFEKHENLRLIKEGAINLNKSFNY